MTIEDEIGYGELERRTRLAANGLRALAVPGDRVVLLLPPGADYLVAFLGCLRAGIVAVPLYPPRPGAGMDRVERVVADCRARLVLTAGEPTEPGFHAVEEILSGSAEPLRGEPDGDAIAFLQYTSGSTAQPKGVMVSHRNLVANELAIMAGFGLRADDVVVSWLPMYHDMGLIGTTLLPLFCGLESVLLNTFRFIRDPASWLRAVSTFHGTCSGGPNFAYGLLADRHDPREQAGLDLSRWRIAFNGAEPVDRPTMDRFAEAYAPHGFRPEAFLPCYGLAEATLFVAGAEPMTGFHVESFDRDALRAGRLASATEDAVHLVASGRAAEGTTVLVRDNDGGVADDGEIGEICVRAPSVARGYWGDEANTAATFHGRVAGHDGDFLRTGDLGALRDGRLYVVGRSKDLIIVAGRNHYPQDVEAVAVDAAPERLGRTAAAFQWDDGRVGLVVEARRGQARLLAEPEAFAVLDAAVRRQVGAACGIDLAEFVVVRPGGIPRTSSGKVRRARTRELLTENGLAVLGRADPSVSDPAVPAATGVREVLRQAVFTRTAGLDPADERRPLAALGFDSLRLVTLRGAVEQRLGHRVDGELFFGDMSIEGIADAIDKAGPPTALPHETLAHETVPHETGPHETGPDESAPLSEGQAQLYFYDQLYRTDVANNLAHAMRFHARLDPALLQAAVRGVVAAHPALRTAFGPPRARRQTVHADARFDWLVHEVDREDTERIRQLLGEFAYRRFDLADGPLVRAAVVVGPETTTLMVVSHHGIVDYWALRIVAAGIAADVLGVGPAFPPPAASPFDWARAEAAGVESARGR
ncbi:LOW QUALITY PROTEIN: non-ribosomal peptide synthetase, partial [Kutzneria sp. 744]